MFESRLERVRAVLEAQSLSALLVGPSADLRYLVGYHALPLERLTLLVVPVDGAPLLVVPELEAARAAAQGVDHVVDMRTYRETDDPVRLVTDRLQPLASRSIAVQDRLWAQFLLRLQEALPRARWCQGSAVMQQLRVHKDAAEIEALRAAAHAIDAVHAQVPALLVPGKRERDVGRIIAELILDDHDSVNFVIVASGPNGASPHHETGDRELRRGDTVVVDIGGTRQGYCSDTTRNYAIGPVDPEYQHIHDVLEAAQQAATDAVAPGVTAHDVDEAARAVIRAAGYGDAFIHRTGHGIGVDEHEPPWIVAENLQRLTPGMAFSIEPGIYIPDRFGARIEDIVAVTTDGVDVLNRAPRELTAVDA